MNILVIEDQVLVARALLKTLRNIPFVNFLETACSYQEALQKISSEVFDFFLVDICLGDQERDGLDLCAVIREKSPDAPIVITTSLQSLSCLEQAFALRVNDYIVKPFHPKELTLRVKRWFRDNRPPNGMKSLRYGALEYDVQKHLFLWQGEPLSLSKRNKDLLLLFLREPGKLLSHQYLKEKYWGDRDERPRNVRSSVQVLRQSLPKECSDWISTIHGEGYVFQEPEERGFRQSS